MKAHIINIGDELLIGQVVNTNASWIAEQLNLAGIQVEKISMIRDDKDAIVSSLDEAGKEADIILITGGLGPTKDDITKYTLAEYFNTKLVFHEETYGNVVSLFKSRNQEVKDRNRRQAEIPESCIPIKNLHGTAPGMWFEKNDRIFVSLPGVPYEMKPMILDYILPKLSERHDISVIVHKTVLTQGVGESLIAEMIGDWEDNLPQNMKLAYLPQPGIVRLRISATGDEKETLEKQVQEEIDKLKSIIGDIIFGYDRDTLEEVVGRILKEQNLTLSTAESCTGGYIAHLITSVPGSSAYYKGSVVAYSNDIKIQETGVSEETLKNHGAVSEATVIEMARGIRERFGTDLSVAVSGIAGPEGGTKQKPVGTTCIAIACSSHITARKFLLGEHRERNIRKAALSALQMLRKELTKCN